MRERERESVWLTCGVGESTSEEAISELRLFFLAVAAATVAAGLLAQPTMKPMEPTLAAANSACPIDFDCLNLEYCFHSREEEKKHKNNNKTKLKEGKNR